MDLISTDWRDDAEHILPDLVDLRRAIHAEPELGLQNPKTLAKIKAALAGLPLELREGPSTTGLIATLKGPANGRTVLLRGDMDALRDHLTIHGVRVAPDLQSPPSVDDVEAQVWASTLD
jgi:hippurate hydrolase